MTESRVQSQPSVSARRQTFEPVLFGRHWLIDRISQGGMSDIYLAKSIGVGGFQKALVIKKLLPQYSAKGRYVKRFINEAKTLARLNHTNIIQILDMGIIDGEYYIALEYIEGRNAAYILSKATRTGRPPSLEFSTFMTMEVAKGLAYAHRKKGPSGENLMLVHQDINSFNVMVSYEAEVKIIDFGIARIFLEEDDNSDTGLPVAGKLLYFSPEQLLRKPVDRRVDIYGVGVLLYELITGERLVQHQETVKATIKAILEMDIRQKVEANDLIPKELRPILIKSMDLDPEQRYKWMEDMIEDLRDFVKVTSLDLNQAAFAKYMKEQFRREILLDKQRLRRLLAEDGSSKQRERVREAPPKGYTAWRSVDLVAAVLDPQLEQEPRQSSQMDGIELAPRSVSFNRGDKIYKKGDPAYEVFLVQKGRIRTFVEANGKRQTVARIGDGELFGEGALMDEPLRRESAEAEQDSHLICLHKDFFGKLIGSDVAGRVVISILEKLRTSNSVLESRLMEDTLSKLIHALIFYHRRPGLDEAPDINYAELKDLFRLEDDDQVRKYFKKLEALSILQLDGNRLQISNQEKLENILTLLSRPGKMKLTL